MLALSIHFVSLSDNEKAPVRSFQETTASSASAGGALPQARGKDVIFPAGTEFTAYVDGDVHLKKEAFRAVKDAPTP
jgi:polygalacturonase